ncbi:MAG TPA: TlpA family protein disulfide reductase, partial [Lachnospiraceae bacterium]|nr:TlpA family protein disulfide reductase [Lachnospiraceae bacterium]
MKKIKAWLILSAITAVLLTGCGGSGSAGTAEGSSASEEAGSLSSGPESAAAGLEFFGVDMDGNEVSEEIFSKSKLTMVN